MERHTLCLLLICAGLLTGVVVAVAFFRRVWTVPSRYRKFAVNAAVLLVTVGSIVTAGEAYFYLIDVQPDGFRFTLAAQRWFQLHWKPINSLGYRDAEFTARDAAKKRVCVFVGDSFAAGSGIPDYRDRFAAVLGQHLGPEWIVPVVAQGGWDTRAELEGLRNYPYAPDLVVLQYYVNDIVESARRFDDNPMPPIEAPTGLVGFLTRHSYLSDRIYWQLYRLRMTERRQSFWDILERNYEDPRVWSDHAEAIVSFIEYTKAKNIPLLACLLPNPVQLERSKPIIAKVESLFSAHDVPVLDLTPKMETWRPDDMVINAVNAHTNAAIGKEIGRWIYESLDAHGLIESE